VLLARQRAGKRNLCSQNLGYDVVGYFLGSEPHPLQDLAARSVHQELDRQADLVEGGIDARGAHFLPDPGTDAPGPDAVFNTDDQAVAGSQGNDGLTDGQDPAGVDHRGTDTLGAEASGDVESDFRHGANADDQDVVLGGTLGSSGEDVHAVMQALNGLDFRTDAALGETDHGGGVVNGHGFAEFLTEPGSVARRAK